MRTTDSSTHVCPLETGPPGKVKNCCSHYRMRWHLSCQGDIVTYVTDEGHLRLVISSALIPFNRLRMS